MPKNRFLVHPKQQTSSMSSPHSHTLGVVARSLLGEEDDDNDICPVCDGECTCNNNTATPRVPQLPSPYATTFTTHPPSTPKLPSLKIKLTVPRTLLGKRRASSSSVNKSSGKSESTRIVPENAGESSSSSSRNEPSTSTAQPTTLPKRRGRPPKAVVAARLAAAKAAADAHEGTRLTASTLSQLSSQSRSSVKRKDPLTHRKIIPKPAASRLPSKFKGKSSTVKNPIKRRRVAASDSSAYSSDEFNDNDDGDSVKFPTFVSASALSGSSSSSGSDSSSLTDFDSDSSIEAEEEHYIIAEENKAHDKARVRRELLGEDNQRKRNDWVIRPRMKSVDASEGEMEVDEDATEDEDEEDDLDEDDDDETDGGAPSVPYAGVSVAWSDGEESSFDAELFFANLSSDSDSTDSSAAGDEGADDVEDDQSDVDAVSLVQAAAAGLIPQLRQELNNLPFEVTQGWDGQIVFTNGLQDGHGILDIDFEVNAAQMVVETSASPSATSTDMLTSDIGDVDQGQVPVTDDDGATTDEDLVGDNDLPNERAMQLFVMPMGVSSIDPMSTLSPVGSPHPVHRRRFRSASHCESPKPADILAGRVFWEDSDGDSEDLRSTQGRSETSSRGFPRTGTFQVPNTDRRAIIDGSSNDLPSPHPRAGRIGRGRDLTQSVHGTHVFDSPWSVRSFNRTSSVPASSRSHIRNLSSDVPMPSSPDFHPMEPVNLDDVLDSSYLESDGSDCHGSSTSVNDSDSKKHIKNLRRWDVIPVGAFRQSHSSMNSIDSWASDTPNGSLVPGTFSNAMKANPLNAMLWDNKESKLPEQMPESPSPGSTSSRRQKRGDRTPTNFVPSSGQQQHNRIPPKTRKELKHEHKLKRKNLGSTNHKHAQHHFHNHNHHPNMKSRGSNAAQRSNFFSSSTSSPM